MKVVKNFLIALLTMIVLTPNAMAYTIIVDGEVDLDEYAYHDKVSFNEDTNTLTLNNYTGKAITFDGFDNNSTINIVLKGNNVISSDVYDDTMPALGENYIDGSVVNLNVTGEDGATLLLNNYNNGIYIYNGKLTVSNLDITATNMDYTVIYNVMGNTLVFKDSSLDVVDTQYPIASDGGAITLNNVKYTSKNTSQTDLYVDSNLSIINSNLDITNSAKMSECNILEISQNSVINVKSSYSGPGAANKVIISDSTITGTEIEYSLIYSDNKYVEINNSTINTDNSASMITANVSANIKDSKINSTNVGNPIYVNDNIEITGGKVIFKATSGDVMPPLISNDGNITLNTDLEIDYNVDGIYPIPVLTIANNIIFNGGKADIKSNQWGLVALEGISLLGGDISIDVADGPALAILSEEKHNPTDVMKIQNVELQQANLVLANTKLDDVFESETISFFIADPEEHYTTYTEVFPLVAKKLEFKAYNKVIFNNNGGRGKMDSIPISAGSITLPDVEFASPAGKVFKGWALDANGTNMVTKVDNTKTVTVYAIWEDGTKIEYIEVPVEKEVTKVVEKEVIKEVEKYIEVPKIVEKRVEVPKIVEKIIEVKSDPEIIKEYVEVPKECPTQEACVQEEKCGTKTWCFALLVADAIVALVILGYVIFKRK